MGISPQSVLDQSRFALLVIPFAIFSQLLNKAKCLARSKCFRKDIYLYRNYDNRVGGSVYVGKYVVTIA